MSLEFQHQSINYISWYWQYVCRPYCWWRTIALFAIVQDEGTFKFNRFDIEKSKLADLTARWNSQWEMLYCMVVYCIRHWGENPLGQVDKSRTLLLKHIAVHCVPSQEITDASIVVDLHFGDTVKYGLAVTGTCCRCNVTTGSKWSRYEQGCWGNSSAWSSTNGSKHTTAVGAEVRGGTCRAQLDPLNWIPFGDGCLTWHIRHFAEFL